MTSNDPAGITNILFPTDFSPLSARAEELAIYLASTCTASVLVLHAIEDLEIPEDEEDAQIMAWRRRLEKTLTGKLDRAVTAFREKGIEARGELIWGRAWRTIFERARRGTFDLVVIGSHGVANAAGHLLLGTTSHKVALSCPVPVLIVRAEEAIPDQELT